MRSRLIVAVLGIAMALAAGGAQAQTSADIFTGKIAPGKTKIYSLTADVSVIIDLLVQTFSQVDVDILILDVTSGNRAGAPVPIPEDDPGNLYAKFESGILQTEKAVISVGGNMIVNVCVTSVSGPNSRFIARFTTDSSTKIKKGAAGLKIEEVGEFDADGPVDPQFAGLQLVVQQHLAAKRSR